MAMHRPLRKVCVTNLPEAEDAVGELLQQLFQVPATVYTDVQTGTSEVCIYLSKPRCWSAAARAELVQRLRDLQGCGLEIGPAQIRTSTLRTKHWAHSWKRHFRPLSIAGRLLIKPSWSRRRPGRGQSVVVLDPGLSFGTGQHPTTFFCLEELVACRRPGRQSLLDIGTGSGILAIAAAKLGYDRVEAFDFDAAAVRVARANARRNQVRSIAFRCQDLTRLPVQSRRKYSVICANLIANLLIAEVGRLSARLERDGTLIVAGILAEEFGQVRQAYEAEGFKLKRSRREGEWRSAGFGRRS